VGLSAYREARRHRSAWSVSPSLISTRGSAATQRGKRRSTPHGLACSRLHADPGRAADWHRATPNPSAFGRQAIAGIGSQPVGQGVRKPRPRTVRQAAVGGCCSGVRDAGKARNTPFHHRPAARPSRLAHSTGGAHRPLRREPPSVASSCRGRVQQPAQLGRLTFGRHLARAGRPGIRRALADRPENRAGRQARSAARAGSGRSSLQAKSQGPGLHGQKRPQATRRESSPALWLQSSRKSTRFRARHVGMSLRHQR